MAFAPGRDSQKKPISTPCIQVCRIAPESQLCVGCLRTLDEIAGWAGFSDEERRAILEQLPGRKT
jgi:predicted Fe-S protein YdhL (DUF1289 family)